tara:strand:+ start:1136 stop:1258 length:123 start_codon:yes stop_codon:yes gene_type:complete
LEKEFGAYGLVKAEEINEPIKIPSDTPSEKFSKIICKKVG